MSVSLWINFGSVAYRGGCITNVGVRRRCGPLPTYFDHLLLLKGLGGMGGSVAEWLACWTQAYKGPGSNGSRDAVG